MRVQPPCTDACLYQDFIPKRNRQSRLCSKPAILSSHMSDLGSSGLFPLLPVEVRLLIWESAFVPQILTFEIEAYRKDEDPTAVPYYVIHNRRPDPNAESLRSWVSGRCVPVHVPPQAIYQVCHRSSASCICSRISNAARRKTRRSCSKVYLESRKRLHLLSAIYVL